jgi:hypothetical protein
MTLTLGLVDSDCRCDETLGMVGVVLQAGVITSALISRHPIRIAQSFISI